MCVSTGNRYLDIGIGVAVGAATGGLSAPLTVGAGGTLVPTLTSTIGSTITGLGATSITSSLVGGAVLGGVGSAAFGAIAPSLFPKQPEYNTQDYGYSPIQYNSQQNTITGSGGAQASALLASEIQRVQRTRRGEEITNTSALNTQPFQTTGLQLA